MNNFRPLLIIGTRPEAIKMAPVVLECQRRESLVEPIVCLTGQHREMLVQVTDYFGVQADLDLKLMQPNQTLTGLTSRCLEGIDAAIARYEPNCVVAQGDTTTVMGASIAAFYRHTPFVHVEAGLRTGNLLSPWPEEFNRRVAGLTASVHCAPTRRAADNLFAEGVDSQKVHVTGNTVIDALLWTVDQERSHKAEHTARFSMLGDRRLVLITGHRRENFGEKFDAMCRSIASLASTFPETEFVYPVHLNPRVREPVFRLLDGPPNVHLIEPLAYPEFIWLMDRSTLILTDSGGVQEEAPSLRKPVLVMRDTTERPEAVEAGAVESVGTCKEAIVQSVSRLLSDSVEYGKRQIDHNPYGDGQAAQRIVDLMLAQPWAQQLTREAA